MLFRSRRATGIFPIADIRFNTVISNMRHYRGKLGLIRNASMGSDTQRMIDAMAIKTPSQRTQIRSLFLAAFAFRWRGQRVK